MKKEVQIGLLGTFGLLILIFGYKYLKGQDILNKTKTIYVKYANVDMLEASNPVLVNGFKVGSVLQVDLDPEDANLILVTLDVRNDIRFPKNTKAVLVSSGLLGDKSISLEFDHLCDNDCLETNSFIEGETRGLISSMMGSPDELNAYLDKIKEGIDGEDQLQASIIELQSTIKNLNSITEQIDGLLKSSSNAIKQSLRNIDLVTGELENNRASITASLKNVESFTSQLDTLRLDPLIKASNTAIQTADQMMKKFTTTLDSTTGSLQNLKQILASVNQGDGTLGKLVKEDELYDRIDRLTKNLDFLIQDVRLNPKRYINVSVFGKKQKEYEKPEDDPAFED